jgi:hypothetical protein
MYDYLVPCCFLKASTVAAPNVKTDISDQMAMALIIMTGIVSRKQNRNQMPITTVGTLTTSHNSFHV